jgi:hypothetical protein
MLYTVLNAKCLSNQSGILWVRDCWYSGFLKTKADTIKVLKQRNSTPFFMHILIRFQAQLHVIVQLYPDAVGRIIRYSELAYKRKDCF